MKRFEFFEHTADIKLRAYGKNLEEAFKNVALAMYQSMTDIDKISPKVKKKIEIKSHSEEALLYDFLDELIFITDTEDFLLHDIEKINIKNLELTATLIGDVEIKKYDVHTHIKAATYSEMSIKKEQIITIQVVLDI